MKNAPATLLLTWLLALPTAPAFTQPLAASAAAPRPARPAPRRMSPAEAANEAATPGDLRPEHPVTPQIRIPLGRKPADPATAVQRAAAPASATVDDAVARCEAQVGSAARKACRERVARERASRPARP